MRDSIHKYFSVGIVAFMAYPNTTSEHIKRIACDDYFDAIEITITKDEEQRKEIAKILKSSHITVCYGAQPRLLRNGLNANDIDEAARKKAEVELMAAIDDAHDFGAKGIAFLSGKWKEETKEQSYQQLLKTTLNLCAYAKTKGMQIVLEVFDYDIAKASLIGPAPLAARFAAEVRTHCNNFGLMIDLSHIPMTRESSKFVVQTLRPYLVHFHIGNTVCIDPACEGYGDEHQRFGFPGGSNDTAEVLEFLRILKAEGFFNSENPYTLSFEVKPWKDEDSDAVVAGAKRVLNRAWGLLEE